MVGALLLATLVGAMLLIPVVEPTSVPTGPAETTPAQTTPAQPTPAQTAPAQTAPAQTAPAQTAPAPGTALTPPPIPVSPNPPPSPSISEPTQILDTAAVRRLKANHGIAVQWISWDKLGRLSVTESGGVIHLAGAQVEEKGPGRLEISSDLLSIDRSSFTFKGSINIYHAPSDRPECLRNGVFDFPANGGLQW
jgi:pyruvate/2-oxoglutarate dehydrogenase complex dihydrolipoamide acyltransferase (E2) component